MAGTRSKGPGTGAAEPWYRNGLRFECQPDCGACCVNHGDYSYVYLNAGELQRMADFLKIDLDEFRARYTSTDDGEVVLRMDQPACPFLEGTRCSVYPVRPAQCQTFPFWQENLLSPARWRKLRTFCPGIDRGPSHPLQVIRSHLSARGTACIDP